MPGEDYQKKWLKERAALKGEVKVSHLKQKRAGTKVQYKLNKA